MKRIIILNNLSGLRWVKIPGLLAWPIFLAGLSYLCLNRKCCYLLSHLFLWWAVGLYPLLEPVLMISSSSPWERTLSFCKDESQAHPKKVQGLSWSIIRILQWDLRIICEGCHERRSISEFYWKSPESQDLKKKILSSNEEIKEVSLCRGSWIFTQ